MSDDKENPDANEWPPPPDVPAPQSEHDTFLTALIRAPVTKPPMSRYRLVRDLRQATGLDLRQCMFIVNSFCGRRDIFPKPQGLERLAFLPTLVRVGSVAGLLVMQNALGRQFAAARTPSVKISILQERIHWDYFLMGLIILTCAASVVMMVVSSKRVRRDAEDARCRFAP